MKPTMDNINKIVHTKDGRGVYWNGSSLGVKRSTYLEWHNSDDVPVGGGLIFALLNEGRSLPISPALVISTKTRRLPLINKMITTGMVVSGRNYYPTFMFGTRGFSVPHKRPIVGKLARMKSIRSDIPIIGFGRITSHFIMISPKS